MHELALVRSICQVAADKLMEYGAGRLRKVKIVAGELTGVEDSVMCSCFEAVVTGTPLEGAELIVRRMPAIVRCRACGNEYETRIPFLECPVCGKRSVTIVSGKELYIDSLEVEENS